MNLFSEQVKNKRNLSNLRNFEGFSFQVGDEDFENKVMTVQKILRNCNC